MSAWGASAWAQAEGKDEAAAPPTPVSESFPVLGAKEEAFPTLGAAKTGGKKSKKQTMSLAEFTASPSPAQASGGGYRAPSSRAVAADDSAIVLPTGPRARAEGEEEQRPSLGGAFRDYGGDRGDRYGGGGGAREYGDREPRRGGFGDREEGGREPDGPSRADEDRDWGASKRFVPSGPAAERRGGDAGPPPGPSRADEDRNWGASKRSAPPPPPGDSAGFSRSDSFGRREEVEADRWARRDTAGPPAAGERPKLQLKPRTGDAPSDAPSDGRAASVFGGAKPVAVRDVPDAPRAPVPTPPSRDSPRDAPPPSGERPRLQLAPRTTDAPPAVVAVEARASSVFGGARPREEALVAKGKDPRVEDLKQFHTVNRPESDEEKKLKAEIAEAEAVEDGQGQGRARELALTLAKLTLELDDKVRFATAHTKENGHHGGGDKWRKAQPTEATSA